MSIYLGRVVGDGEPEWLPEDREVVEVWQYYEATRHDICGKWEWEWDDMQEWGLEFDVCPFCVELEKERERVSDSRKSMAGVQFVYTPPGSEGLNGGN